MIYGQHSSAYLWNRGYAMLVNPVVSKGKHAVDNGSMMGIIAMNTNIKEYRYENHTNDP